MDENRLYSHLKNLIRYKITSYCLILGLLPANLFSQENRFFTLSNVKARPLAMGGAFTAIDDDLAAINFNPATYLLNRKKTDKRWTFFLNPISPFVAGIKNDEFFNGQGSSVDDLLLAFSMLVKSVSFSISSFEVGVLLGEEGLNLPARFVNEELFRVNGYRQNHSHSFVGRLKLADKVSLGGSINFFFGSTTTDPLERNSKVGVSYGILLKPEKGLRIGVSFINLPDTLNQFRFPLERIVDESVTFGISYQMFTGTLFSIDVKNLGEEQNEAVREFHFGFEQPILSQIALRAGFFQKSKGEQVYSWGVGLFSKEGFFGERNQFKPNNFLLNYAYVFEKTGFVNNRWHFLSFYLSI